ncbi:MAG: endolytic transglycosylase MltG [Bdellovibrionales bacterium]|nr:endolytic transglycosylase MltG [Bdellovibrionales bacterium]NQZ18304.1 endolytic transglycosylase MltG [Bdellovibrionales bacterium]
MKKFFIFLIFALISLSAPVLYTYFYMNQAVLIASDKVIDIPKGASLYSVANILEKNNIIDQSKVFVKIGQFYGYQNKIKYGEYLISSNMSVSDVYQHLMSGENVKYSITLVEGENMYSFAQLLEKKNMGQAETFLRYFKDKKLIAELLGPNSSVNSLEGYLFPDTYLFSKHDNELIKVKAMVNRFLEETKDLNFQAHGMDRHKLITLASIVEKETGAAFERRKISSVFHNRMKKKMRLQTDPTILYGILHETGKLTNNIRKKDIKKKTAYNTYVIKGLPPGPIASPGIEAIKAALNPDKTSYLYFVSRNDGTHVFTTNYKDHQNAVRKFQLNRKMREGRSWRDLKKKPQRK